MLRRKLIEKLKKYRPRLLALLVMALLSYSKGFFALAKFPGLHYSSGISDFGHYLIPSALLTLGLTGAQYLFWLGSLPLEFVFIGIALYILFTGKGLRLGLGMYAIYWLHWLLWHMTVYPTPPNEVWEYPAGVFTMDTPFPSNFWFSGHTALSLYMALATEKSKMWVKLLAWGYFFFVVFMVLSVRVHYSADVLGAIFVAYTFHRVSKDIEEFLRRKYGKKADEKKGDVKIIPDKDSGSV